MVVRLTVGDLAVDVLTDNISADGLFLRTDLDVDPLHCVHLDIDLPFGLQLSVPAVVVRQRSGSNGQAPGIGVRFYPMTELEAEGWAQFVELVSAMATPNGQEEPVDLEDHLDPIRRRHPRLFTTLGVRMRMDWRTYHGETRDVSANGLFVLTDASLREGDRLQVEVEHPAGGETFALECVVRRQVRFPTWSAGVGLEIT